MYAGLRSGALRFFKYMLALVLLNFTVGSLALAIGAAVGKFSIANPIYVMILVISMVNILVLLMIIHLSISTGVQWIFDQST